ncbi:MAG: PilZ domain-containing protein [Gammaproteobacteria bacterium]|nr:PilZ domain-containing protein [Gammaproteobacteria bacterium]
MAQQRERRDAFRIDVKIYLHIITDDGEEKAVVDEKLSSHLTTLRDLNYQSNHLLAGIRKNHPDISQFLALLDKKINILTRIVSMEQIGIDVEPNMRVNMSSSGLAFSSDVAYSPGRILSIHMVLFPAYVTVTCQAKVVYCRAEGSRLRIALDFVDLDASERELLIRYMIEKQSEQLRTERSLGK